MAVAIGDILAGLQPPKERRTFQPCRRNSFDEADRRAGQLWKPLARSKGEARRLIQARMQAAEYFDRKHKAPGARNGPLGHVALEVLRELYRFVDFKTGRCDPAIDTICARTRRARAAVVAAMKRLKTHGFLDWVRRTEATDCEGKGPQVRQISNAYGFGVPAAVAAWIKSKLSNGPTPACAVDHQAAQAAATQAMLDTASTDELVDFVGPDDAQLSESLKAIGRLLESSNANSLNGQNPAPRDI